MILQRLKNLWQWSETPREVVLDDKQKLELGLPVIEEPPRMAKIIKMKKDEDIIKELLNEE